MNLSDKIKNNSYFQRIEKFLRGVKIPTLEGINLYTLIEIYVIGIAKGSITSRAAASSWSLFLSLFPFLLFVYSWLPYLPNFDAIEKGMYDYLVDRIFPQNEAVAIENYVSLIANRQGKNWFTILLAIVFATNGINSLMNGFMNTSRKIVGLKERTVFKQYLFAALYTISFTFILIFFLWLLNFMLNDGRYIIKTFSDNQMFFSLIMYAIFYLGGFIVLLLSVTVLYYFSVKYDGKFISMIPGAFLTTLLFFALSVGFSFYIENFNNYNLLYGSISTLLIVMLFLYATVLITLFGFELNMTLLYANNRKNKAGHYKDD